MDARSDLTAASSRLGIDEAVVVALLLLVGLVQGVQLSVDPLIGPGGRAAAAACGVALLAVQLLHSARPLRPLRRRLWPVTLPLEGLLCYLPVLAFHWLWVGFGGFALASCLILLPRAAAWTLVVLAEVVTAGFILEAGASPLEASYFVLGVLLVALGVWSLTRLSDRAADLRASRRAEARLAVASERDRFSEDLSDLLSGPLDEITRRAQAAIELLGHDATAARGQVAGLVVCSRSALADVRALAHGGTGESLRSQVQVARGLLDAAGVHVSTHLDGMRGATELPGAVEAVFAAVVQHAVAGILGQARVRRCRIELCGDDRCALLVVAHSALSVDRPASPSGRASPAAPPAPARDDEALAARVARTGGSLRRDIGADGWSTMTATVPIAR